VDEIYIAELLARLTAKCRSPGFPASSGCGAADEAVLSTVNRKKIQIIPLLKIQKCVRERVEEEFIKTSWVYCTD
jgi:hypothetical protein